MEHDSAAEPASSASKLPAGVAVRVRLVKPARRDLSNDATVIFDDGDHIVITAPFAGVEPLELGYVTFEVGDQFTEHYWRSRRYSIKEMRCDSRLKGWYCDIARPASVSSTEIRSLDLDLDVWVDAASGAVLPLDEDEFAASGLADRDPDAAIAARDAVEMLLRLSRTQLEVLITPPK